MVVAALRLAGTPSGWTDGGCQSGAGGVGRAESADLSQLVLQPRGLTPSLRETPAPVGGAGGRS